MSSICLLVALHSVFTSVALVPSFQVSGVSQLSFDFVVYFGVFDLTAGRLSGQICMKSE